MRRERMLKTVQEAEQPVQSEMQKVQLPEMGRMPESSACRTCPQDNQIPRQVLQMQKEIL